MEARSLAYKTWAVAGGQRLTEPVRLRQEPLVYLQIPASGSLIVAESPSPVAETFETYRADGEPAAIAPSWIIPKSHVEPRKETFGFFLAARLIAGFETPSST